VRTIIITILLAFFASAALADDAAARRELLPTGKLRVVGECRACEKG